MGDFDEQYRAMEYIWQDWEQPITTGDYNKYLRRYVDKSISWKEIALAEMPAGKSFCRFGEYQAGDGEYLCNYPSARRPLFCAGD